MNNNNEFDNTRVQHRNSIHEMYNQNEIEQPKAFKTYTKSVTMNNEHLPIQTNDNNQSRIPTNVDRRRVEQPSSRIPSVRK